MQIFSSNLQSLSKRFALIAKKVFWNLDGKTSCWRKRDCNRSRSTAYFWLLSLPSKRKILIKNSIRCIHLAFCCRVGFMVDVVLRQKISPYELADISVSVRNKPVSRRLQIWSPKESLAAEILSPPISPYLLSQPFVSLFSVWNIVYASRLGESIPEKWPSYRRVISGEKARFKKCLLSRNQPIWR